MFNDLMQFDAFMFPLMQNGIASEAATNTL